MKLQAIQVLVSSVTLAGMAGIFTSMAVGPTPQGGALNIFVAGEIAEAQAVNANFAALEGLIAAEMSARENADAQFANVLMHFTRVGDDIFITGANLHIVNGTNDTETTTGFGNLIIGYNEERPGGGDDRTGSHMLVVGKEINYSSYGGIVVGIQNTTSGIFSSVSGGQGNTANGVRSSVSGGVENTAEGPGSWVGGGGRNMASGEGASVSGGIFNVALGEGASISGGGVNKAFERLASISGGTFNTASGQNSSVTGGINNTASGVHASVTGGEQNTASGQSSTVSGGFNRVVLDLYDWAAGLLFQDS